MKRALMATALLLVIATIAVDAGPALGQSVPAPPKLFMPAISRNVPTATPTATPTSTFTPTITHTPTRTPTFTGSRCGGEIFNVAPAPRVNQPFQIRVTAGRNLTPRLTGTGLASTMPVTSVLNGNGTWTFAFDVSPISQAGSYNYNFSQGGQICLTIPVTVQR